MNLRRAMPSRSFNEPFSQAKQACEPPGRKRASSLEDSAPDLAILLSETLGQAEEILNEKITIARGKMQDFVIPLDKCAGKACHLEIRSAVRPLCLPALFAARRPKKGCSEFLAENTYGRCLDPRPTMTCSVSLRFGDHDESETLDLITDLPMERKTKGRLQELFHVPANVEDAGGNASQSPSSASAVDYL